MFYLVNQANEKIFFSIIISNVPQAPSPTMTSFFRKAAIYFRSKNEKNFLTIVLGIERKGKNTMEITRENCTDTIEGYR